MLTLQTSSSAVCKLAFSLPPAVVSGSACVRPLVAWPQLGGSKNIWVRSRLPGGNGAPGLHTLAAFFETVKTVRTQGLHFFSGARTAASLCLPLSRILRSGSALTLVCVPWGTLPTMGNCTSKVSDAPKGDGVEAKRASATKEAAVIAAAEIPEGTNTTTAAAQLHCRQCHPPPIVGAPRQTVRHLLSASDEMPTAARCTCSTIQLFVDFIAAVVFLACRYVWNMDG